MPRRRYVGYRPYRRRSSGMFGVGNIIKIVKIGAFLAPGLARGTAVYTAEHNALRAVSEGLGVYAGFQDGQFDFMRAVTAWSPYLVANVMSAFAGKANMFVRRLI